MKINQDHSSYLSTHELNKLPLWDRVAKERRLLSCYLEITARCNNNCRHCYINVPAGDDASKRSELSSDAIKRIAAQAVSLGALWCGVTGGEPLLRKDFVDIYLYLKKIGLLISVFTNATLITKEHIELFKKYPPRDIEVTVYGVTKETYERVTRLPGSFDAFMKGVNLLLDNGIKTRFKTVALRSNVHELDEISKFCRERTKDFFRFDPFLHLRFDGNRKRNKEIISERLSPEEIVDIEKKNTSRFQELKRKCNTFIRSKEMHRGSCHHLFFCGAGNRSFIVSANGLFRLCSALWHSDCIYDLTKGTVREAYENFVPRVRNRRLDRKELLEKCTICPIINLCMWCPGNAYLETGDLNMPVEYFCKVAYARKEMLEAAVYGNS
ncbi:radical SAM protein [Candidatus Omnitrophota bacterium]